MILGFTGTRDLTAITQQHIESLTTYITQTDFDEFHHGDCTGADELVHGLVRRLRPAVSIHSHPPLDERFRAFCQADVIHAPRDYLVRNQNIIAAADHLLAVSSTYEETLRSGTWATIRRARAKGIALTIIIPNGAIDASPPMW